MDFFEQYFVNPLFDCSGYNVINTFGFIALLVLITFGVKRVFEKKKIGVDEGFFWMLVPFVLFGGIIRSLEDLMEWPLGCQAARADNPLLIVLITPFIYMVLLFFVLALIALMRKFTKDYKKNVSYVGWALVALSGIAVLANGVNWYEFGSIMALSVVLCAIVGVALREAKVYSRAGLLIAYGQVLDASATSIAVGLLGYGEQHVFTNALVSIEPFLFIPVKMLLAFLVVYAIEKESKGEWKWLLAFIVLMIGLAPGMRDALRVLMGV